MVHPMTVADVVARGHPMTTIAVIVASVIVILSNFRAWKRDGEPGVGQ